MKTLKQKIAALKLEHKEEIEGLKLQEEIKNELGFEVMVYSSGSIGFQLERKYIQDSGIKNLQDVHKVLDYFIPTDEKGELRFAGKDPEETKSNIFIRIQNYGIGDDVNAELNYVSICGKSIKIELNNDVIRFSSRLIEKNKHSRAKDPEWVRYYCLGSQGDLGLQKYATGNMNNDLSHLQYHGTRKDMLAMFNYKG